MPAPPEIEGISEIRGFTHGVLRSSAFRQMKERLPDDIIETGRRLSNFVDTGNGVSLSFEDGSGVEADLMIGADGVQSVVSRQLFGDPGLFKVWLAHCGDLDTLSRKMGRMSFTATQQISYFPMVNDGVPGFEWWICEPYKQGSPVPDDVRSHLTQIASQADGTVSQLIAQTNFDQIYQWEIYNRRECLKSWSSGRVVCLGDAVHPVSPYAGYGMGMAIEDGCFIGKFLGGGDLGDAALVEQAFAQYEATRIDYVNGHVLYARRLGRMIHNVPLIVGSLRNLIFRHTNFIGKNLEEGYLADAIKETYDLAELHIAELHISA